MNHSCSNMIFPFALLTECWRLSIFYNLEASLNLSPSLVSKKQTVGDRKHPISLGTESHQLIPIWNIRPYFFVSFLLRLTLFGVEINDKSACKVSSNCLLQSMNLSDTSQQLCYKRWPFCWRVLLTLPLAQFTINSFKYIKSKFRHCPEEFPWSGRDPFVCLWHIKSPSLSCEAKVSVTLKSIGSFSEN